VTLEAGDPPGRAPAVTVVVACFLRHDGLRRLLAALEKQTFEDFEVVVVDQVGDSVLREITSGSPVRARWVEAIPPAGTPRPRRNRPRSARRATSPPSNASRARNTGAAASRSAVILFTDDDCVPEPNWVEGMSEPLRLDPKVIAVTGANRILAGDAGVPSQERFSGRIRPNLFPGQGGSSNLAVRRADFFAVGGFDTSIGPGTAVFGAEDQHLVWRLLIRAEDTDCVVVGRRDAVSIDRVLAGRWAPIKQRWVYMTSFGRMMRRERLRQGEAAAASIVADMMMRDTPAATWRALRRGQAFVALQGVTTELALAWGWVRGRHLQDFVPEIGTAAAARSPNDGVGP